MILVPSRLTIAQFSFTANAHSVATNPNFLNFLTNSPNDPALTAWTNAFRAVVEWTAT